MRTDQLIAALAADAPAVDPARTDRRFFALLAGACALAMLAMLVALGPRADLAAAAMLPMFWVKLAFPASLMVIAALLLRRLGYPGMRLRRTPFALGVPVAVVWILASLALLSAPAGTRVTMVMGSTWAACLVSVALLSIPAAIVAFTAARGLAPTRLPLAGAAVGLFAGSAGAFAYALHCPELQAPFLAVWYLLAMLVPAAAGALLGRAMLHW